MILSDLGLGSEVDLLEDEHKMVADCVSLPVVGPAHLRMRYALQVHQLWEIYFDLHLCLFGVGLLDVNSH